MSIPEIGSDPFEGVFIRAPVIEELSDSQLHVFARLSPKEGGHIVGVYNDHILGTCFHPELTADPRIHAFFLQMISKQKTVALEKRHPFS